MATLGVTNQTQPLASLVGASEFGPVRLRGTLTGGNFVAGQILGRITASGKLTDYDAVAIDGSAIPVAVLLEACDALAADKIALVGFAGVYLEAQVTGLDAAAKLALEPKAIYFI